MELLVARRPNPRFYIGQDSAYNLPDYLYRMHLADNPFQTQRNLIIDGDQCKPADVRTHLLRLGCQLMAETDINLQYAALVRWKGSISLVTLTATQGTLSVNTASRHGLRYALIASLTERFPPTPPRVDHTLRVNFWFSTLQGPQVASRRVLAPEFDMSNYAVRVSQLLQEAGRLERPEGTGKLMLWHGTPGTGKTYAVRGLAWAWKEWCTVEYVTDPESFLGDAQYMMSVLLGSSHSSPSPAGRPRWKLIVLEDAGELIGMDSKEKTGQAFSRLLNVTEGLIGQGLEVLILITTNEDISKLNPAVKRPGRCLMDIGFTELSTREASGWCEEHGLAPPMQAATLAELFAYRSTGEWQWGAKRLGLPHG